jgi:cation:H+ antiporter
MIRLAVRKISLLPAAVACLPIFARGSTIPRWQGWLFLLYYGAYTAYLVLDAKGHESRHDYGRVMLQFVIPLTALTLGVIAFRVLRARRSSST